MKKICIDARMINNSGIGTYIKALLNNLDCKNFEIFLIVNSQDLKSFEEFNNYKKFKLIIVNAKIYSIKEQIVLPFKIPSCDLFFSPHYNVPLFPIRAKKRLLTIHDVYHLAFFEKLKFLEKIYAKFMINKAIQISDRAITVSKFSKSEIIKYTKVDSTKIEVIYNGVDLKIFKKCNDQQKISQLKDRLKIYGKYFLFIGNLKPHKNLVNIIKAFENFYKKNKDYKLVIIGKCQNLLNAIDINEILEGKKELKEAIVVIDYVSNEDLSKIYQLAQGLIFASLYEGFGYPALEAMSIDCPCIVSNKASLPEICLDAAIYVDPYNASDITNAMTMLVENNSLKENLINKGRDRVRNFSIQNFIQNHQTLIETLL